MIQKLIVTSLSTIIFITTYAQKLQQMLGNIVSNSEGDVNMALANQRPVEKVMIIVVTSDRGLCGGYNSNLIKLAKQTIIEKYAAQHATGNVSILPIGKKGYENFTKNNFKVINNYWDILGGLTFEKVQAAAKHAMDAFADKEIDAVELVYSEFKTAAAQRFVAEPFLPVQKVEQAEGQKNADFIFEPGKDVLIAIALISSTIFIVLLLDSFCKFVYLNDKLLMKSKLRVHNTANLCFYKLRRLYLASIIRHNIRPSTKICIRNALIALFS